MRLFVCAVYAAALQVVTQEIRDISPNVPGGVSSVNYYVRAQRDLAISEPSEEVTVNFPAAMAA